MMKVCLLLFLAAWCAGADLPPQSVEVSQDRDAAGEETMLTTEILFGLNEMFREEEERKEKSLLNSFPFNQAEGHGDHASHGTHEEYHGHGEHGGHHGHGDHEGHEEPIDHERHHQTDVG